ncbi:hypothetical protein Tco_1115645, partial [Tanacetum coccineum]
MAGALRARNAARNLEPLIRDGGEQEEINGNGGNGNGNVNGGGNGVVGLTRWFEKMETVFHISNCPEKYQVKYATRTLLNSALTWWNSQKRTIGIEAAYTLSWAELMKLMTEVYCEKKLILLMVKDADLEISMHGDYYGMLNRSRRGINIMETYPHLDNDTYDIVEKVMRPLALRQTRRPRSDRGKARRSVSSSSSHHQGTSSHQHDDDDDDIKTSRASTPSPTTYLNFLNPLDYQNYHMPSSS